MVNYEDFAKLEIKIGEIKSAEIVEGADKLLKLSVDIGEGRERQIISGIRAFFPDPSALVGKKCPFLTNLEPRIIKGIESEGMMLAAADEESFALLLPHVDVPTGTKLK